MNLIELLNSLDDEKDVYIGSKSAYFFMDKPSVFIEEIKEYDYTWQGKFYQTWKSSIGRLEAHKQMKPIEGETQVKSVWENGNKVEKTFEYTELIDAWTKRLDALETNAKMWKKQLDEFKPFEEREVKEAYLNINKTAIIIIIEGYESGKFWLKSEWNRFKNGETVIIDTDGEEEVDEYAE